MEYSRVLQKEMETSNINKYYKMGGPMTELMADDEEENENDEYGGNVNYDGIDYDEEEEEDDI
jgi:hypothetical protein